MSTTSHRNTKQRQIILDELRKVFSHPTAREIHIIVKKKMPEIGFATVYRNLEFLEKQGEIIKLKTKDKEARYDGESKPHLHLICSKCGEVFDVDDFEVSLQSKQIEKLEFKTDLNCLEINGTCKNCSK